MKVRLKRDITEGTGTLKVARRSNRVWQPGQPEDDRFRHIPFVKGAEIEMSEESARKYIERDWAEPVEENQETMEIVEEPQQDQPPENREEKGDFIIDDNKKPDGMKQEQPPEMDENKVRRAKREARKRS